MKISTFSLRRLWIPEDSGSSEHSNRTCGPINRLLPQVSKDSELSDITYSQYYLKLFNTDLGIGVRPRRHTRQAFIILHIAKETNQKLTRH